jgi:murein hydrolase activator
MIGKLLTACILILSHSLHAAPNVEKEDLKQLRSRIEALQKELVGTEESKSEVADALRESERAITDANRKLAALTQAQGRANDKLSHLQTQSKQIKNDIEVQQSQLSKLLYRQYVGGGGQKEYLSLLLNQQDPSQIARNLHY